MAGVDILSTAFSGANTAYLAELYARWAADPGSVDPSFATLFSVMDEESAAILQDAEGASWSPRAAMIAEAAVPAAAAAPVSVES
ncbi:2-oxoglutarate dehydrogenase E1 subunit family protein, partial [Nguyenibacter vanlangensis]